MIIDLARFIAAERPAWTELEELLDRLQSGLDHQFTIEEARRLHFLYQKTSADLAKLATFASEPELRRYLETLVGRAYGEINETRERGVRWRPLRWFLREFPAAFRRRRVAFVVSTLVTLVGCLFGGFAVMLDDEAKSAVLPGQFAPHLGRPSARVQEEESAKSDRLAGVRSTFAGQLMVNNIRVSINAMAFGMTWGIGTFIVLFYNGIILGLVGMDYILDGQAMFLLGWLLPHGVIEIPAILIAGQAGFVLGAALIGHGDRRALRERLRSVGPDVATLIGGVAAMLVWAGIVESFISQYHQPVLPYWLKIAFGLGEGVLLVALLANRGGEGKTAG
jgi:uncharacterized membrane protein SpoIIM required for sporulation